MAEGQIIIKKKRAHAAHAHHGGSWKVAYADFVTAMMAFFMVMWIMGLSDDTRTKIQGYFNDPLGFSKSSPSSKNVVTLSMMPGGPSKTRGSGGPKLPGTNVNQVASLDKAIKEMLAKDPVFKGMAQHISVGLDGDGLRIEFREASEPVFFDSGSKELKTAAIAIIRKIAPILIAKDVHIVVEGHTDSKPYAGTGYTNLDLSNDRAGSLYHALLGAGAREKNFQAVTGYADKRLKFAADPLNPQNRRVSILVPYESAKEILGGPTGEPKPSITPAAIVVTPTGVKIQP